MRSLFILPLLLASCATPPDRSKVFALDKTSFEAATEKCTKVGQITRKTGGPYDGTNLPKDVFAEIANKGGNTLRMDVRKKQRLEGPVFFCAFKDLGGLTASRVQAVVDQNRRDVEECFGKHPNPTKLLVQWVITPDGKVKEAKVVRAKPKAPKLSRCVLGQIRTWTFPKPTNNKDVKVRYPFSFAWAGEKD